MNLGRRVALLAAAGSLFSMTPGLASAVVGSDAVDRRPRVGRIEVPFTENCGRLDESVAFSARTFFGTAFVTRDGRLVYSLPPAPRAGRAPSSGWSLTETLIGAHPSITAGRPAPTRVSVFEGRDPQRWQSTQAAYEEVRLGEAWPGVSVSVRAHGDSVEKLFVLSPGGRPEAIRLRLDGARSLRIDRDGSLVAETANGDVRFTKPVAYQDVAESRRPVEVAYRLRGSRYGFRLGRHDPSLPVVIDPLLQSTYLGGSGLDSISAIAVHPTSGEIYVSGGTNSTDFPGTVGGAASTFGGIDDSFVARFDAKLTTLLQATYYGGAAQQGIGPLAFDPMTGDVLVGGFTTRTSDLPGTSGGAQATYGGGDEDGWVARLDASLTTLIGATYLGGLGEDFVQAIAVDPASGDVFAAGYTGSNNLPGASGAAQAVPGGLDDAFVTRLDPRLKTIRRTTYLGGSDLDRLDALVVDASTGDLLVGGLTISVDFPFTAGGAQAVNPGGSKGFVARIDPSLTAVRQATYLGGQPDPINGTHDFNEVFSVAIQSSNGEIVAAGTTASLSFPATAGGAQPTYGGGDEDGFVARLDGSLTRILQATYLGGGALDFLYASALASNGDVIVAGQTASLDFPGTTGALQSTNRLGNLNSAYPSDGFVARLDSTLTLLRQATYLGGDGDDEARAIAVHPTNGEILVAGDTTSDDFPGTGGGAQPVYVGGGGPFPFESFVARLSPDLRYDTCVPDAQTLCLSGGRFRVTIAWNVPAQGLGGYGTAVPLTSDTGAFWFREDSNLELVVKVLDGRSVNGHFWVFSAALSNAQYTIFVTDTDNGEVWTYDNPLGTITSVADTSAFPRSSDSASISLRSAAAREQSHEGIYSLYEAATESAAAHGEADKPPCSAGGTTLCLNQGRFQVSVEWAVPEQNRSGHGTAVPLPGGDTGYFWFLDANNVELMVKMLDGRPVNGHFWFFFGALSDVQYTITVTDTETGRLQVFENPDHTLASRAETGLF